METRSAARRRALCKSLFGPNFLDGDSSSKIRDTEIIEEKMETRSAAKRKALCDSIGEPKSEEKGSNPKRKKTEIVEEELQLPTNYMDIIPHVPLRLVYKYLPVEDIVNTYSVSPRMNQVATEKGTWKDKVLKINDINKVNEYVEIIQHSPLLRAVYIMIQGRRRLGNCNNFYRAIVHTMAEYLEDLQCLRVVRMSSYCIKLLVEKFKNLEVIDIGICVDDLPSLLGPLKSLSKLKVLYLNPVAVIHGVPENSRKLLRQNIIKLLLHSCPSLIGIDFEVFEPFLKIQDMIDILNKKKNQLLSLSFGINRTAHWEVMDVVSSCEKLKLDITITEDLHKIDKLKSLKSIRVTLPVLEKNIVGLNNMFSGSCMPNVEALHLHVHKISPRDMQGDVLRRLIIKFPKLQELDIVEYHNKHIDDELDKIGNLTELRSLTLDRLRYLTHRGLAHLSKCASLKELSLSNIKFTKHSLENILKCPNLERITIDVKLSKQIRHSFKMMCAEKEISYTIV